LKLFPRRKRKRGVTTNKVFVPIADTQDLKFTNRDIKIHRTKKIHITPKKKNNQNLEYVIPRTRTRTIKRRKVNNKVYRRFSLENDNDDQEYDLCCIKNCTNFESVRRNFSCLKGFYEVKENYKPNKVKLKVCNSHYFIDLKKFPRKKNLFVQKPITQQNFIQDKIDLEQTQNIAQNQTQKALSKNQEPLNDSSRFFMLILASFL